MKLYFLTLILLIYINGIAQDNTFKALIVDNNYEPLYGAEIWTVDKGAICFSNDNGFCINIRNLSRGIHTFHVFRYGYYENEYQIELPQSLDTIFTFVLKSKNIITDSNRVFSLREMEFIDLQRKNWSIMLFDSDYYLSQSYFINENTGWAVGGKGIHDEKGFRNDFRNGIILQTTDAGASWITQLSQFKGYFHSVCFVNQNTGFVVGYEQVLKTTNKGIDWIKVQMPALHYGEIFFENETTCYLHGWTILMGSDTFEYAFYLLTTFDGGITWDSKRIKSENEYQKNGFNTGFFVKDNVEFALSNNLLHVSKDNGKTWESLYPPSLGSIFFVNEKVGYAISPRGMYLLKTVTGGE